MKTVRKVLIVDPPSGWKYGFPKACYANLDKDEDMVNWLLKNGYPKEELDKEGKPYWLRSWYIDIKTEEKV